MSGAGAGGAATEVALPFRDREEAGRLLGERLRRTLAGKQVVVLGIPRGGVIVAAVVAEILGAPLDVIVARKLGAPWNPELAIGAVTSDGTVVVESWAGEAGVEGDYFRREQTRKVAEAKDREARFRAGRPPLTLKGRIAVLVDDGIATGATMEAAVRAARNLGAERVIVAAPVASAESAARLAKAADELVVLAEPEPFEAVGLWYRLFDQVPDDRVVAILHEAPAGRPTP